MFVKIPVTVLLSVALLLATHAVGLWHMILLSRTLGVPLWMPYSTLALLYSLLVALLAMVLIGKRWARNTYSVLAILGLLSTLPHATSIAAPGLALVAAKLLALVLLYVSVSNRWFNEGGHKNSFRPNPPRGSA